MRGRAGGRYSQRATRVPRGDGAAWGRAVDARDRSRQLERRCWQDQHVPAPGRGVVAVGASCLARRQRPAKQSHGRLSGTAVGAAARSIGDRRGDPRRRRAVSRGGIRPSGFDRIDLVPGSRFAASFNIPDPHRTRMRNRSACATSSRRSAQGYDLVIIDCPPNLHAASWSAMAASDYLLVPVMPEDFGARNPGRRRKRRDGPRRGEPELADARLSRLDVPGATDGPSDVRRGLAPGKATASSKR